MLTLPITRLHVTRRESLQSQLAGVGNRVVTSRFLHRRRHSNVVSPVLVCTFSHAGSQREAHLSVQRLVAALLLRLSSTGSCQLLLAQRLQAAHRGSHGCTWVR